MTYSLIHTYIYTVSYRTSYTQPRTEYHIHSLIQNLIYAVFAGELGGAKGLPPPPHSWAADPSNDVAVWHIKLDAGLGFKV